MEKLKLNSYQMKLFMAFLMVLDHLKLTGLISPGYQSLFHVITRVVGVWFAYSAVEGFLYSRNVKKYIARLFLWAAFMDIGNSIINMLYGSRDIIVHNNIFLTLALGVLLLYCIKSIDSKIVKFLAAAGIFVVGIIASEGGMVILPFMLITYYTYKDNKKRNIGYLVLSAVLLSLSYHDYGDIRTTLNMLAYNSDFLFILVLPFIYMYNGERGNNSKFSKYFFYVFYPLHLWVLATIGWILAK